MFYKQSKNVKLRRLTKAASLLREAENLLTTVEDDTGTGRLMAESLALALIVHNILDCDLRPLISIIRKSE